MSEYPDVIKQDDGSFVAVFSEDQPGISAIGASEIEALRELTVALVLALAVREDQLQTSRDLAQAVRLYKAVVGPSDTAREFMFARLQSFDKITGRGRMSETTDYEIFRDSSPGNKALLEAEEKILDLEIKLQAAHALADAVRGFMQLAAVRDAFDCDAGCRSDDPAEHCDWCRAYAALQSFNKITGRE